MFRLKLIRNVRNKTFKLMYTVKTYARGRKRMKTRTRGVSFQFSFTIARVVRVNIELVKLHYITELYSEQCYPTYTKKSL